MHILRGFYSLALTVTCCACLATASVADTPVAADSNVGPNETSAADQGPPNDASHQQGGQEVTVASSGGNYIDPVEAANNAVIGDKWCKALLPNSCRIHVAAGIYILQQTIELPPGVALAGDGMNETIITSSASPVIHARGSNISNLAAFGHETVVGSESTPWGLFLYRVRLQAEDFAGEPRVVLLRDMGGTTKIADSEVVAIRRSETPGSGGIVSDVEGSFRSGASLKILGSHLVADNAANTEIVGGPYIVAGLLVYNSSTVPFESIDIKDTSFTAPSAVMIQASARKPIMFNGGIIHGLMGGIAYSPLQIVGTRVFGRVRWGSTSTVVLDGVSVVVPEKVASNTIAVAVDAQAGLPEASLILTHSQVAGGVLAIFNNTFIPAQIDHSVLTQQSSPTCRVYGADGVPVVC